MIEIIDREEGKESIKKHILGRYSQISYNSDDRIVIRIIETNKRDTLIVLGETTSEKLIGFCQNVLRPIKKSEDIPF